MFLPTKHSVLVQLLCYHEALHLLVIAKDSDIQTVWVSFQIVSPFLEESNNSQQYLFINIIILFGLDKLLAQVCHWVQFNILVTMLRQCIP